MKADGNQEGRENRMNMAKIDSRGEIRRGRNGRHGKAEKNKANGRAGGAKMTSAIRRAADETYGETGKETNDGKTSRQQTMAK